MPPLNTWAGQIICTEEGMLVYKKTVQETATAGMWELTRWLEEAIKLAEVYKKAKLLSPLALAAWMNQAAGTRLKYARLCAASVKPGAFSLQETNKIKEELRGMIAKDPIGAKEFALDPWSLLQQKVHSNHI
jgi:hypothetical protein